MANGTEDTLPGRKATDAGADPDPSLERTRASDPLIGQLLGEYRILERLGQGGMGIVYRGEQPVIGKAVAIKVLLQSIASDTVLVQRMVGEARAVNAVRHPNIIDIFSFGQLSDGRPYMVMELLEGESLASLLVARQSLTIPQTLTVLSEAMAAVEAAHAVGVVHRDLKPDNIFVNPRDEGWKVTLLDFGLAKREGPLDQKLTTPGAVMGTPSYMAPEQIRGAEGVSAKTDIYAMGIVAWTMLVGREPFGGGSAIEVMHKHLSTPAPSLKTEVDAVSNELDALVMQMLQKDPHARPTASEVRRAIAAIQRAPRRSQKSAVAAPVASEGTSKTPLLIGLGVLVLAVAGGIALTTQQSEPLPIPVDQPLDQSLRPVKRDDPPPVVETPIVPVVVPEVQPTPTVRTTAKTWRCSQVMNVTPIFKVPNTQWSFFALTIQAEPQLLVTSTNDRAGKKTLARMHKAISACRTSDRVIKAAHTNDQHPGVFNEEVQRFTGIEAAAADLTVSEPEAGK